jgi:hypothetical protein
VGDCGQDSGSEGGDEEIGLGVEWMDGKGKKKEEEEEEAEAVYSCIHTSF